MCEIHVIYVILLISCNVNLNYVIADGIIRIPNMVTMVLRVIHTTKHVMITLSLSIFAK